MYISLRDIGTDSNSEFMQEGHASKVLYILKNDAHQKHDLHIMKFFSLEGRCCCCSSSEAFFNDIQEMHYYNITHINGEKS
jgi:hypothetical protein